MLGLSTALLDAHKRGDLRRGREVRQLDLAYSGSSLTLELPARTRGPLAGDRAPDARVRGNAGVRRRLFEVFKGPHWTLLGYDVDPALVSTRPGLHIHTLGRRNDLIDDEGYFAAAYAPSSGDWILVRPDGYIGAIVSSSEIEALESYLQRVGLGSARGTP
jgi:hypothetical protein